MTSSPAAATLPPTGDPLATTVAEWNFATDPARSLDGRWTLHDMPGSRVRHLPGVGIAFDGRHDGLRIDSADVGDLHVAARGDRVTVVARVRRHAWGTGFVAGMWQEDDLDPRRQYGLFVGLPTYGGAEQVVGHVSHDGRPSPRLRYSREYSATARMQAPGAWRVIGFTYDGAEIRSYLDGISDERARFTERLGPLGEGLSYAKNPYRYPHGLNRRVVSDFTVGAVRLTAGPGNHFAGEIHRLAVWDTALSASEMLEIARAWTPTREPLLRIDPTRPTPPPPAVDGGHDESAWPASALGLIDPWPDSGGRIVAVPGSTGPVLTCGPDDPGAAAVLDLPPGFTADLLSGAHLERESDSGGRIDLLAGTATRWWATPLSDGTSGAAEWRWRPVDTPDVGFDREPAPHGEIRALGLLLTGDGRPPRVRSLGVFAGDR